MSRVITANMKSLKKTRAQQHVVFLDAYLLLQVGDINKFSMVDFHHDLNSINVHLKRFGVNGVWRDLFSIIPKWWISFWGANIHNVDWELQE